MELKDLSQVHGRILDIAGRSVEGASIAVYEDGIVSSVSSVSSSDGAFSVELEASKNYVLGIRADGFADQIVPVKSPDTDGEIVIDATLIARAEPITISDNGSLTHMGVAGATVTVDKADFVDAAGSPVMGDVELTITPVDISNPASVVAFPGSFSGVMEGETEATPIVSLGVVEYEFTLDGQPINLAPNASAEIIVPIYVTTYPDGSAIELDDTIPLWSLNESTSLWKQEGEGVVVSSDDSPTGLAFQATVTHFSWWNCDVTVNPAKVEITVLGVSSGDATILANAPGLVNWRGENASTTVSVGDTTAPLSIPSGIEVCYAAAIFYDGGDLVTTEQVCLTADAGANLSVILFDPSIPLTDSDGDGIADVADNCRAVANPQQLDSDSDGFGNMCDGDYDNNGNVDSADFARFQALFDVQDPGADLNGDGQVNLVDLDAFQSMFGASPGPGAGVNEGPTSAVEGRITDIAGIFVPNATVTVYQDGAILQQAKLADVFGEFDLALPAAERFSLLISAPNFANQVVPVASPDAGGRISIAATLIARAEPITISDNGILTHTGDAGATVTVDKADFVDVAGNPISGDIELTITPVDVSNPAAIAAFPGSFSGVPEGQAEAIPIVSLGVVEYDFTQNGQPINLAENTSAEIIVPIYVSTYPDGSTIQIGDSIPLWSLNEATSIWKQEGEGVVVSSSDSPTGFAFQATVTHFSWWNCDVAPQTAQVEITVLGEASGDAVVFANAPGLVNWRGENASTTISVGETTDPLFIPAGLEVCFRAGITYDSGGFSITDQVCVTTNLGEIVPILLSAASEGPLNVRSRPQGIEDDALTITALTDLAIPPVELFPVTLEASVSYAVTAGKLPKGLSLDTFSTRARVVGTPLETGSFSFTVTATDSDGFTDELTFTYIVGNLQDNEINLTFSETKSVMLYLSLFSGYAIIDWNDGSPKSIVTAGDTNSNYPQLTDHGVSRVNHVFDSERSGSVTIQLSDGLNALQTLASGPVARCGYSGGEVNSFTFDLSVVSKLNALEDFIFDEQSDLSGSIASLPKSLKRLGLVSEKVEGSVDDLPTGLTKLRLKQVDMDDFPVAALPRGLLNVALCDTGVSGALTELPKNLTSLELGGENNTITGDISTLPESLTYLILKSDNTIDGDIATLPKELSLLRLMGNVKVTGNISTLSEDLNTLALYGDNTVTGDIATLTDNMVDLFLWGRNTVYGDLGLLKSNRIRIINIGGNNAINEFSPQANWMPTRLSYLNLPKTEGDGGFDSIEIDRLLMLLNENVTSNRLTINLLRQNDASPTSASAPAISSLVEKGFSVNTH